MNLVSKASNNPYTNEELFKICEDYGVPHNPLKYRDEKFYWTYQKGVKWPDDYRDLQTLGSLEYQKV